MYKRTAIRLVTGRVPIRIPFDFGYGKWDLVLFDEVTEILIQLQASSF
jgi:hypothetical protein